MLGKTIQGRWRQAGYLKSRPQNDLLGFACDRKSFDGWLTVLHKEVERRREESELAENHTDWMTLRNRLGRIMTASQVNDGDYYGCPALPGFHTDVRRQVTSTAIKSVLESALKAAIDVVEKSGLVAVQDYLPLPQWDQDE